MIERVRAGVANWLLVDKQAVTMDGSVCNKIGTSYEAFRQQASACTNAVPTKEASGIKAYAPPPLLASDASSCESRLYPKPNVETIPT